MFWFIIDVWLVYSWRVCVQWTMSLLDDRRPVSWLPLSAVCTSPRLCLARTSSLSVHLCWALLFTVLLMLLHSQLMHSTCWLSSLFITLSVILTVNYWQWIKFARNWSFHFYARQHICYSAYICSYPSTFLSHGWISQKRKNGRS